MFWFLLCAIVGSTIAFVYLAWRKWIAPWRQIEQLVQQIAAGDRPRTFLVDGAAQPRRVGLALENIFGRQQHLDRRISEATSGTQTVLSAMQDGLLVVDSSRRVTLVNETFRQLFAPHEISPGAPLLDTVRNSQLEKLIVATLGAGEQKQIELGLFDPQNHRERWMQVSAVPMKDDVGGMTGAVVLFHDITELKRTDQMRSDFVANVSHELRTPLSILRGYIETLIDDPKSSSAERRRILEVMERHSKRLGLLVDDLLILAQLESADSNLQLSDARENGEVRLRAEQGRGEIALSVSDDGVGIDKNDLPRIFERFYRADKARSPEGIRGTGLGLAIVKHIAQLHGGRVEAESELGKGTTIRVILPGRVTI